MRKLVLVPVVALLIGCGDQGTVRIDSALAKSAALQNVDQVEAGLELPTDSGTLTIEQVRIAVSEVELEGDSEDEEFEVGERTVGVALDGSATEIAVEAVPVGRYEVLGLELTTGASGFGGASILVDGNYEGTPFTYRSTVAPELEFTLPTPAEVIAGGQASVAVTFDVAAWFRDANGNGLNPTDPANGATIEGNIVNSMAAFAELEFEEDGDDD